MTNEEAQRAAEEIFGRKAIRATTPAPAKIRSWEDIPDWLIEDWKDQQEAQGFALARAVEEFGTTPRAFRYHLKMFMNARYYDDSKIVLQGQAVLFRLDPIKIPQVVQRALEGPQMIAPEED